jgi:hypothetical protein
MAEAQQEAPQAVDLFGAKEAAEALGVRVQNLGKVAGLPSPVTVLACGNIYDARQIRRFAALRRARRSHVRPVR